MVILVLAILAFVFVILARVSPNPRFDFTWIAVLLLTIIHLLGALVGARLV